MNSTCRNYLFFLICICLPFLFVPKGLQFTFIGGPIGTELIVLPILCAYLYTGYCWRTNRYICIDLKSFGIFSFVYVCVLLMSLLHGLYIYPYHDLIFNGPTNQIEKLPAVLVFLHSHGLMISQEWLLSIWIVARFFKAILLEIIYTFGFSYIIYCWFAKDPGVAVKILQKSIYIIVCIMVVYSFFELFYFFGYTWAKSVLVNVNPLLHAIKENFGWWPPLLWDSPRVRSIFPEPSQFGMYAAFIVPFIWENILNKRNTYFSLFVAYMVTFLMFLSLSKTANGLLLGELGLLAVYILFRHDMDLFKRYIMIIVIVGLSFGVSLWCISNYYMQPFNVNFFVNQEKEDAMSTAQQYVDKNLNGIVDESSGSNGARFAIINSDVRIWKDHFFLGVGNGLKSAYTEDYLTDKEQHVPEVIMWGHLQAQEGILKSGYPSISEFSKRMAENGIIGLLLYVFPLIYLFFIFIKKKKYCQFIRHDLNILVCILISLIASFMAGISGTLTTFESYWIVLGIAFAYAAENKAEA